MKRSASAYICEAQGFQGGQSVLHTLDMLAGDLVFLTSDGISDNFDPVMRKQARPATGLPGAGYV